METKYVGIDVSKLTLDFDCLPVSASQQFANDTVGVAALVALLQGSGVERIVIEATGGYETSVVSALAAAGLPVVVDALPHPGLPPRLRGKEVVRSRRR